VLPFVKRRLLLSLLTLFGVTVLVFLATQIIPGDPTLLLAGPYATKEDIEALRVYLGLDKPPIVQYFMWLSRALRADFGTSWATRMPVVYEIAPRWVNTFALAITATIVATVIGLGTGVFSATRRDTISDHLSRIVALVGVSMPLFWTGLLLMALFAVRLGWLPTSGNETPLHYVLPSLTLGIYYAALLSRTTRASMVEIMSMDYVRTARAKGLPESVVIFKHAFRNALIPVITVIGIQFGYLLGGAVVVETIFRWPGIGSLMINSILTRDFPMMQAAIMVFALSVLFVSLVVDLLYAVVDPKIRYET